MTGARAQEITPITSGAVIAHQEATYEITGYADIYVQLTTSNREESKWNSMLTQVEAWITAHASYPNSTGADPYNGIGGLLRERVAVLKHQVRSQARHKRGLLDFIGKASKYLFGTATNDDVKSLAEMQSISFMDSS